jgi:hypothetical protein
MGKWGDYIFDDDDAANFAYRLDDVSAEDRVATLRSALETILSREYHFDYLDGVHAVAAAALIARELEGGHEFTPTVGGPSEPFPPSVVEHAETAGQAVMILRDEKSGSDWWFGASPDDQTFRSMLNHLHTVLSANTSDGQAALW